jgi:hypothetical protein
MFSFTSTVFYLALAAVVHSQDTNVSMVESALTASGVIPDVLPSNFVPKFPFDVRNLVYKKKKGSLIAFT